MTDSNVGDLEFDSVDVAKYIGVDHNILLKKFRPFVEANDKIEYRETESVKPLDGSRLRHAYRLSLYEFIYLVAKYHPKGVKGEYGFVELIDKVCRGETSRSEIMLRNAIVENFGRSLSGLDLLTNNGEAVESKEIQLTPDQLAALDL